MKSIYSVYISSCFGVNQEKNEGKEVERREGDTGGGRRGEWGNLLQLPCPTSEGWDGQELKEPHQAVMERLSRHSGCEAWLCDQMGRLGCLFFGEEEEEEEKDSISINKGRKC